MIKKMISTLCAMIFCLGLLPIAAYAVEGGGPTEGTVTEPATLAAMPDGQVLYVGDVSISFTGYWTTDSDGNVAAYTGEGKPLDNYIYYDAENNTLTLHNATIKKGVSTETNTLISGAAIGVLNQSGAAELTIQLEGDNTIEDVSTGIYVLTHSSSIGTARLTITGSGSLIASGSSYGIQVQSNSGNAALTIRNADVTAENSSYSGDGVTVRAGSSLSASLSVDGGNLTATGIGFGSGIKFQFGNGVSDSGTPSLTVSGNAIMKASGGDGGISTNSSTAIEIKSDSEAASGGIVFDGNEGTVYGNVTLQDDLTIDEGESLTLDDGASLDANGHNVIVDGGTLDNTLATSLGDSVKYAPTITTTSPLSNGTVGTYYEQALVADGTTPITWSVSNGDLPAGLSLDASTGVISGTPKAEGESTFTVEAANDYGSDSREFTLSIDKPVVIHVTGVKLDKTSLSLQENGSDTLTATVEPDNATNKNVNWESSDTSIATVDASGKVTAVAPGTATITVTTVDGSKTATCKVTVTHGLLTHVSEKAPTCTAEGNKEYWACGTCGKIFSDAEGKTEIELSATVIPATGHHYIEGKCSVCGAIETTATVPNTDNSQEGMDNVDANNKALPEISDSTLPLAVVALILGIGAITGIVIALRNMRQ